MMNKIKKYIGVFLCLVAMVSCKEDYKYPLGGGNPIMELNEVPTTAFFGDSIPFNVYVSDDGKELSTLKVHLYFSGDLVSETVIRTKEYGHYNGKIYVPFLKNIPDGTAQLKFVLENVGMVKKEQQKDLALSRPDFPYLTLIDLDGEEYRMEKESLYHYSVIGNFPQALRAHIKSPKVGENGNELIFGKSVDNQIIVGETSDLISFSGTETAYEVTFNILTYAHGPLVEMTFDGEDMIALDADSYYVQKTLTQGQTIQVTGVELAEWWGDPDYFTKGTDGSLTFLPMSGEYRVVANTESKSFAVTRMEDENEATLGDDGHGALWLMGWGIGSPLLDSQFGWNPGAAYCVAEISSKKYQFTGVAGPEHGSSFGQRFRLDYLDFKFFFQNDWGGEFSSLTLAAGSESLIKLTSSWNIGLADGVTLEEGATYVLTVDLTEGNDNGVVSFEKKL
ncbi:MAG TPA: DUF5125 domain-containing protein [Sphingobacterium sp.]|jgi:hypothetical protein|nr:DUF5125 domain-containing protein [Sphingobacterium sp.]